ncbi:MAG TPA: apolipoprotein N-acyltransferase [Steroidobacteraceae bacterium]|jgi:apolipoprotein N-acyltransferase|nr:apolipoprotein N-acyltransferase [Steroidobacteraceae bacterium]
MAPIGAVPLLMVAVARHAALARRLLAFGAGALLACSFAPFEWWPLAILCPAVLMWLWEEAAPREAAWMGFWFSFGTFLAGTYWLYVSVHDLGKAPVWLTIAIMLGLIGIMALYNALIGYVVARWLPRSGAWRWLIGMPAAWLLIEWWRGWFLSGFSWLSLGYSQTDTWLAALAPVVGVYGISLVLLMSSGALIALLRGTVRMRLIAALMLIAPWAVGAALGLARWTHPSGAPVSVAVIQANIPQEDKWLDSEAPMILKRYRTMTESALGAQLIVWPEAALPDLANNLLPYIATVDREAQAHGSSLVMGVVRASEDGERYYDSILALGKTASWYAKDHLVPFAEFFPVPHFVRNWLRLMTLPYESFSRGGTDQSPLPVAGLELGPTVCYEVGYGSYMLNMLPKADALVNVTNDAWFGHSTARYEQFQMARMRSLEEGRSMIVASNDGISAIIGPYGELLASAPPFQQYVLRSSVTPRAGLTPFARVGNWLIVSLAAGALAAAVATGVLRRRSGTASATTLPPRSLT